MGRRRGLLGRTKHDAAVRGPSCRGARPRVRHEREDRIESAYRFLLADMMPFGKNALICLEHGGTDESAEHYRSVTFWYGIPSPSLIRTDRLRVGDPSDERAHGYASPEASAPYEITSRYELGVDHVAGPGSRVVFPAEAEPAGRPRERRSSP